MSKDYFIIAIKHVHVCYESVVPDNGNMIKIMLTILRSITVCPDLIQDYFHVDISICVIFSTAFVCCIHSKSFASGVFIGLSKGHQLVKSNGVV